MIYGGINSNGQYLKDTYFLNMGIIGFISDTLLWENINIDHDFDDDEAIAFHTMVYIQKHD